MSACDCPTTSAGLCIRQAPSGQVHREGSCLAVDPLKAAQDCAGSAGIIGTTELTASRKATGRDTQHGRAAPVTSRRVRMVKDLMLTDMKAADGCAFSRREDPPAFEGDTAVPVCSGSRCIPLNIGNRDRGVRSRAIAESKIRPGILRQRESGREQKKSDDVRFHVIPPVLINVVAVQNEHAWTRAGVLQVLESPERRDPQAAVGRAARRHAIG